MEYEIKPKNKFSIGLKELWEYRELFFFFTWRDIKVKYKQTFLGIIWVILQPAAMATLFAVFFQKLIQGYVSTIPYPVFVLSGLVIWTMFSSSLSNAGNSMVTNANIIKKIYFPRLIIPISAVFTALFDMLFGIVVLVAVIVYYRVGVDMSALWLWPAAIVVGGLSALGLGTFLSALNVKYRDFRYVIPFLIQAMLFITPVIYPFTLSDNPFIQTLFMLNPVSGAIELFRAGFADYTPDWNLVLASLGANVFLFLLGLFYFRKTESYFADIA